MNQQLSFFPESEDFRPPVTVTWNGWHGCDPASSGCLHCYMIRRDREYGKDPSIVHKTAAFNLPVRRYRTGPFKGFLKFLPGPRSSPALLPISSIRLRMNGAQKPGL